MVKDTVVYGLDEDLSGQQLQLGCEIQVYASCRNFSCKSLQTLLKVKNINVL